MKTPEIPNDEAERLETLKRYNVLDTPRDVTFDAVTRTIAENLNVPIALISLVDDDRQWFKSSYGLDADSTPRDISFCAHAIHSDEILVVSDAATDERFRDNPLVTGEPFIRFYAGAPLISPNGKKIGTVCAIDRHPRELSVESEIVLEEMSKIVIDLLETRASRTVFLQDQG